MEKSRERDEDWSKGSKTLSLRRTFYVEADPFRVFSGHVQENEGGGYELHQPDGSIRPIDDFECAEIPPLDTPLLVRALIGPDYSLSWRQHAISVVGWKLNESDD